MVKKITIEDKNVLDNYNDDLDLSALSCELQILKQLCENTHIECFQDLLSILSNKTDEKYLIPNIVSLCLLHCATTERSFSMARRIKTWEKSTMLQKRFNSF